MTNFSWETMQARRQWNDIFKVFTEKNNCQKIGILYPTKLFFKSEDEVKSYPEKQKLREFVISMLIEEMLEG